MLSSQQKIGVTERFSELFNVTQIRIGKGAKFKILPSE